MTTNKELRAKIEKLEKEIQGLKKIVLTPIDENKKGEEYKINDWIFEPTFRVIYKVENPLQIKIAIRDRDRKATNQEIKEHLIGDAKKKGFDIGVKVKAKNSIATGKIKRFLLVTSYKDINDIWNSPNSIGEPDPYYNEYFDKNGIFLAAEYFDCIVHPINELEIVKEKQLTFGGEKVELKQFGDNGDIQILCEGKLATLGVVKKLIDILKFQIVSHNYLEEYNRESGLIKIGCLTGTLEEIENIIEEAEKLK